MFIGRHLVCGPDEARSAELRRRKIPLDWLGIGGGPGPKVTR